MLTGTLTRLTPWTGLLDETIHGVLPDGPDVGAAEIVTPRPDMENSFADAGDQPLSDQKPGGG
jgi:hypothetical protein